MKDKVKKLIDPVVESLELFVSDVYYSNEEGVKTLNIELDSDNVN